MNCPKCGHSKCYVGLFKVECENPSCEHYIPAKSDCFTRAEVAKSFDWCNRQIFVELLPGSGKSSVVRKVLADANASTCTWAWPSKASAWDFDQSRFDKHLKDASDTVANWPAWKRNLLGNIQG